MRWIRLIETAEYAENAKSLPPRFGVLLHVDASRKSELRWADNDIIFGHLARFFCVVLRILRLIPSEITGASRLWMKSALSSALIVVLGTAGMAQGATVYWDDGDGNSNTISSAVWADIQTAINSAQGGAGTRGVVKLYGNFQRNQTTDGNSLYVTNLAGGPITISGGWDVGFTIQQWKALWASSHDIAMEPTYYSVLDINANASYPARALRIDCSNVWVEGVTVKNGYRPEFDAGLVDVSYRGAGLVVANQGGTGLRLSHLLVTNNYTISHYGAGLYIDSVSASSPVTIEYCGFRNNTADGGMVGGAICKFSGRGLNVVNCIFTGNIGADGSAVYLSQGATVFGCLFTSNGVPGATKGVIGGGLQSCNMNIANCTLADNNGYGIYEYGNDWPYNGQFRNCIFSSNAAGAVALENSTRTTPFTDGTNRAAICGRLLLNDSAISNPGGSETYWDEGGIQFNTDPKFRGRGMHRYQLDAGSLASDSGGPTNVAWQGQGVDSNGFLRVMTSAEKTTCLGASAAGYSIRYVNVLTYAEVGGSAPNAGYDAKIDVIVDLGGYVPTAQNYLDNLIYPYDLAGSQRVKGKTIDIGAYEYLPGRGTVITIK